LEKGIKPKGKDFTRMLPSYSLALEQCFDDYSNWVLYGIFYPMCLLKKNLFGDSFIARKLITLWNWMFMNFAQMN
jgi:hypothetical protein